MLARKNHGSRELLVAQELFPCLQDQLRALAEWRRLLQLSGQLFAGCLTCWAAAQGLVGHLPGWLEHFCCDKPARDVEPSSTG